MSRISLEVKLNGCEPSAFWWGIIMSKSSSDTSAGLLSLALAPERLYDFASSFNLFKKLEEADPLERAMLDKDHVFQAIEVADLFIHKESSQSDSLRQLIHRTNLPMLALDAHGTVLEINDIAKSFFSLKDSDVSFQSCFNDKSKNELWSYLNRVSVNTTDSNLNFIDLIELEKGKSGQTYFVCVKPWKLSTGTHCLLIQAVNIRWPAHMKPLLQKTFNLTESEIAIFKLLSEGISIKDTASQRNTSVATVRTQIREIYAKTGTTSQIQFIRFAVSLAALNFEDATGDGAFLEGDTKTFTRPCYPREEHWHLLKLPDGRNLDYVVFGSRSGTPCLFFHNEILGDIWPEELTRHAISQGLKIILPARPLYRRSSDYPKDVNYIKQTAQDFLILLNHLKIDKVRILSQTLGGMFAMKFASMFEDRVQSLCFISPMLPFFDEEQRRKMPPMHRLVASFIVKAPWMMEFMAKTGFALYLKEGPEFLLRRIFASTPVDKKILDNPHHMKTLCKGLQFGIRNDYKPYLAGFKHKLTNSFEIMKALTVPIAIIIGSADKNTRQNRAASLIEHGVELDMVIAEDGGELLIFTHPELIIDTVVNL